MSLVIVYRNVHKSTIRNNWCVWCIKYWLFGDKQVEYCSYSSSPKYNQQYGWKPSFHPSSCGQSDLSQQMSKTELQIYSISLRRHLCVCAFEMQLKYLLLRWNIGFPTTIAFWFAFERLHLLCVDVYSFCKWQSRAKPSFAVVNAAAVQYERSMFIISLERINIAHTGHIHSLI